MNHLGWTERQCVIKLLPLMISISFAMDVFVPSIPQMTVYFQASNQSMQASLYLFMGTVALGHLLIGPLSDCYGRRPIALLSALLLFTGSLLSALAISIPLLLIARVLQGLGACGTYLLCFIVIRDHYQTQVCGRLFSVLTGMNSVIACSAPIIGGVLLDWTQDWRSGFYFMSILSLVILVAVRRNIPHYPQVFASLSLGKLIAGYRDILQHSHFRQYTLSAATGLLGLYLFCALSPDILIRQLHNSGTQYGLCFGLNAFTMFAANLVAVRLTHRIALEAIVNMGLTIIVLAAVMMLLVNSAGPHTLRFMLPMLCLTSGIGLSMGCAIALALKDFASRAALATALVGASQFGLAGLVGYGVAQHSASPISLAGPVLGCGLISLLWNIRNSLVWHR
ncbi:MAG: multidrug effflux MFS transporter [Legionellaceae bacterium]|nr:multidrug effflux MFS transporter [Legionellaceae bacterium]